MRKIKLQQIVERGASQGAKSIFLFSGFSPLANRGGVVGLGGAELDDDEIDGILQTTTTKWQYETFKAQKELDYSHTIEGLGRFRISAFFKHGGIGIVLRPIPYEIPHFDSLGLPAILKKFTTFNHGLILITGSAGSGKSTTLAAMVDLINQQRVCHIVTIEDLIEFIHKPEKSIVSQREVGRDTRSYDEALKRVLREDPDVVVVGDIRDGHAMKAVLEIAETGHLTLAALHTSSAVQTIQRIIDFFGETGGFQGGKKQIRNQIANVLIGIVSQRLLRNIDEKRFICACEVLINTQSVKNLIREGRIHQIPPVMDISKYEGMVTMNNALLELYEKNLINVSDAIEYSSKEKGFIEKVIEKTSSQKELFGGEGFFNIQKETVLYEADCSRKNLSYFDSSGNLINTPLGLVFRDSGRSKSDLHFIVDYTIVNGRKEPFSVKSLFSLTYKILDVKLGKNSYNFSMKLFTKEKEAIEMPNEPAKLMNDHDWHSLVIPVPKPYAGTMLKYYMLLFEDDIREIVFTNIYFV
ncbi:MAG: PilT/PilU family type 4a pilus ATPase [Proteobacteria bacterium]|nr:PilT/PilU family type 4a pilus ATPase [Pseudomonadota bacterium]